MKRKVFGILIVGLLVASAFPMVSASIDNTDEKENTIVYESRIFGIGFVRLNGRTQEIKGFVIFGINDGQVISLEFINIKCDEADEMFAGFFPPLQLTFYIRYNPA